MTYLEQDIHALVPEHGALLRHYARLQRRCTELVLSQAREIERLEQQVMRLRAQVMLRDSALAWAWEDQSGAGADAGESQASALLRDMTEQAASAAGLAPSVDLPALEHSLRCADLVICQTGCMGHGAFWRVEDHCKRTGKTCVLVDQPGALNIVRIHSTGQTELLAQAACPACSEPLDAPG
ncbi:DUF2325 domain-containing protein [Comamonas composti]|uniref:DUF2325 domain-containing protein n=1 Tax=Comamonas composti TaxID=408558 RepID=UPI0009FE6CE0|nr:DUF2325 domain-containing protein [Comamonas composti]